MTFVVVFMMSQIWDPALVLANSGVGPTIPGRRGCVMVEVPSECSRRPAPWRFGKGRLPQSWRATSSLCRPCHLLSWRSVGGKQNE